VPGLMGCMPVTFAAPENSNPGLGGVMRVLVAGDRGYIGAVLVPFVREAGHQVNGLDLIAPEAS